MKDLLAISDLSRDEIERILPTTDAMLEISQREIKRVPTLRGRTVINLFLESSTRTRVSFELTLEEKERFQTPEQHDFTRERVRALREHCALDAAGQRLIADAVDRGGMSARAVYRALRVARTIADLLGEERVTTMRVAEALQYRAYESRRMARD